MKQIFQDLGSGEIAISDLPIPTPGPHEIVVQSRVSIVSPGTERMLAQFALANPLQKALQQPERVRQVIQKIRTDGLSSTLTSVRTKLSTPIPVGYSNAGVVVAVGSQVPSLRVGDRVTSNGAHAEAVCVPWTLCARIPESVAFEDAAFTPLAAIALQGIRLINPSLGEVIAVQGLGLLGLLAAQILTSNGCQVLAFDPNSERVALASSLGIAATVLAPGTAPSEVAASQTRGTGVDAVLITASSPSNSIVHEAAAMCRRHGRIVLIGSVGLHLDRRDFYEKELSFQVSCSYGPGRYESQYERSGLDFPPGYVRWTAQRNFEAVLALLEHGQLKTQPLVSERIAFSEAAASYQQLLMAERSLGIAFHYDTPSSHVGDGPKPSASRSAPPSDLSRIPTPRIGVIGAGQFSSTVLCPSLAKLPVTMTALCSSRGAEASALAKRYRFDVLSADSEALLASPLIDVAFITTRHHSHARLASLALKSGKNVFVEKPLALSLEELRDVTSVARASPSLRLMVGFNRRFSPLSVKAREVLALSPEPRAITITVNAGKLDPGHWLHDREIGGGRLLGEGCHFIDLALFFAGSRAISAYACATRGGVHDSLADVCSVQLQCENGSIATILYLANGSRELPKERVEIFSAGRVLVIDNFRELRTFGATPPTRLRLKGQDKGHDAELMQFISAISTGGPSPLSLEDLEASTRATLAAHQSLLSGRVVAIPQEGEAFTQTSIQPQRLNVADHS